MINLKHPRIRIRAHSHLRMHMDSYTRIDMHTKAHMWAHTTDARDADAQARLRTHGTRNVFPLIDRKWFLYLIKIQEAN